MSSRSHRPPRSSHILGQYGAVKPSLGMQREHAGGNLMTAAETLSLTHPSLPVWPIISSLMLILLFLRLPSTPSSSPTRSRPLFQTPLWQIAFTLLHFRIITRRCHPEKLAITTTLRFNSSITDMTDDINEKNGPNNNTNMLHKTSVSQCIMY